MKLLICIIGSLLLFIAVMSPLAHASGAPKKGSHAEGPAHKGSLYGTGGVDDLDQPFVFTPGGHPANGWGDGAETPNNSVAMPTLLVPSVVDGRQTHHMFITYRLLVGSQLAVDRVNQKVAWLHDAFMREIYRNNPTDPENRNRPDLDAFEAQLVSIAEEVFHDDVIKGVWFRRVMSEKDPRPDIRRTPTRSSASSSSSAH